MHDQFEILDWETHATNAKKLSLSWVSHLNITSLAFIVPFQANRDTIDIEKDKFILLPVKFFDRSGWDELSSSIIRYHGDDVLDIPAYYEDNQCI